jgi:short-subunit dehydrogenase
MDFEGKRVLVTGGAGAMGVFVANDLLSQGAQVTVVDRAERLPFDAPYVQGDLSTSAGIAAIIEKIGGEQWDILVNLAGIQYFGPFESQSTPNIEATYMVNLVAPSLMARAVLPAMIKKGWGQIVNIGSVFGSINFAHFVTYSSSKAGLAGLSQALRRELAGSGVGVTYIAPRAVNTPLSSESIRRFAKLINMPLDDPHMVAARIVRAIARRERDVYIGFPEGLFVRINAILPRIVDLALAGNDKKARELFTS